VSVVLISLVVTLAYDRSKTMHSQDGGESQSETESQGNIPAGMKSTIYEFDMMSNVSVRSANGTDYNETLYLPSFKLEQNTTPSTEDLIEIHDLIWGMKQAMLYREYIGMRNHWRLNHVH